eukprot:m.46353 g.46353  ORF g.46353 m.46353 type:complete len:264 (+) comp13142_c0_seq1:1284-2075(+)
MPSYATVIALAFETLPDLNIGLSAKQVYQFIEEYKQFVPASNKKNYRNGIRHALSGLDAFHQPFAKAGWKMQEEHLPAKALRSLLKFRRLRREAGLDVEEAVTLVLTETLLKRRRRRADKPPLTQQIELLRTARSRFVKEASSTQPSSSSAATPIATSGRQSPNDMDNGFSSTHQAVTTASTEQPIQLFSQATMPYTITHTGGPFMPTTLSNPIAPPNALTFNPTLPVVSPYMLQMYNAVAFMKLMQTMQQAQTFVPLQQSGL